MITIKDIERLFAEAIELNFNDEYPDTCYLSPDLYKNLLNKYSYYAASPANYRLLKIMTSYGPLDVKCINEPIETYIFVGTDASFSVRSKIAIDKIFENTLLGEENGQ